MNPPRTPMRWPASWTDPASLSVLKGTAIDYLILETGAGLGRIAEAARLLGIAAGEIPSDVRVVAGKWPGIQAGVVGGHTSAGPTGVPWIDSSGWKVRLEAALHPGSPIWVDALPKQAGGSYELAAIDAAVHGGRWIVTADEAAAAGGGQDERWRRLAHATAFFSRHANWLECGPAAVIGVISDFSGPNEFLSRELLNLLARANQQYTILLKGRDNSFRGLKALLYADSAAPDGALRREILAFVESGGLLIAGPEWGVPSGMATRGLEHPRYEIRARGKGRIAVAKSQPEDPYLLANDSVVLVSHRYELLRFWNCGAVGSYLAAAPAGHHTLAHLIFYADQGPRDAAVRIAGRYRTARLWTLDRPEPQPLELHTERDGMEMHLPPLDRYAAIELEV